MKKLFKLFGYLALSLSVLVVLAVIVVNVISDEQYKAWVTEAVESATGRSLMIAGDLNLHFGSTVGFLARDISFSNADWGSREQMITADRLFVQLSLLPLFKGVLDITLELDDPDVMLEKDENGMANWTFKPSQDGTEKQDTELDTPRAEEQFILPLKPFIRNFEISNLVFSYADPAAAKSIEAQLEVVRLHVDENKLPLTLKALYQGAPIVLEGTLGDINDWHANRPTPISLAGKLNEADITIEGTGGPILPQPVAQLSVALSAADIATFTPLAGTSLPQLAGLDISLSALAVDGITRIEELDIRLDDPHLKAHLTGTIDDITNGTGIKLNADIATEQGTALGQKLGDLSIESIPDFMIIKAAITGTFETLSITDVDISVKDEGVDINLSGTMEDVLKLKGADAVLTANLSNLGIIGGYIGQELPSLGPFDLSAKVTSVQDGTQLESLLVTISDPTLSAELSGTAGPIAFKENNTFAMDNISITGRAESSSLAEMFNKIGIKIPVGLPSSVSVDTTAAGNFETLAVDKLEVVIKDEGIDASLFATIGNILDQSGIEAKLTADVADTASLSKFAGMEIPALGPLTLSSQLTSTDSSYKINALDVQLDGQDVQASVTATVEDLLALVKAAEDQDKSGNAGVDMSVDIALASLAKLIADFTGLTVPDVGALTLNGQVRSENEVLGLESFNLKLDNDNMHTQLTATVANLPALVKAIKQKEITGGEGLDLSLKAEIGSISELAARTGGIEIPDLGGLKIQGQVNSVEQALQLKSLTAVAQNDGLTVNVDAAIADMLALSGINSTITAKIDSLQTLSNIIDSELPQTGPWQLKARASSDGIKNSPLLLNAKLEGEETSTIVDATLPDRASLQNILAKVTVDVQSLSRLGAFFEKELPDKDLKISSNIAVTPGEYKVDKFLMLLGKGKILSELAYTTIPEGGEGRSNLTGQITIQDIDLTPLYTLNTSEDNPEAEVVAIEEEVKEVTEKESSTGNKKLFSSDPLAVGALQDYDVDLQLEATGLTIHDGFSLDGNMAVNLDRGLLTVEPFTFSGDDGGTADGEVRLDSRNEIADLDILLDFNDFVLPRLGGKFSLDVDLEGKGDSIAALMGSLDGIFMVRLNDTQLEKTILSKFGAGLLSQINPLASDVTTLECSIARFDITDGLADFENKLAAQTTEVTWIGGGEINLKTEELDVGMAPKPRKAISSLTDIGLASLVHVGGTLAEPKIGIDAMDAAKKYAGFTAHIATGGLSFLAQKAYENRASNIDQCERILAELKEK